VIVHCGASEEVYEKPERPFVAGFIGISTRSRGLPRIAPCGLQRRARRRLPASVATGTGCRPRSVRNIALDALIEDGMVVLEVTVVERAYLGTTTQVIVELAPGVRLVALEPKYQTGALGRPLRARYDRAPPLAPQTRPGAARRLTGTP
jgi:ABC-type Fe3+/spermidine/putrescine transport system ATPase subunit